MKLIDIFEDLTIPQLKQSTIQGFPKTKKRQYATGEVRVDNLQYIPFQGNKLLRIRSQTVTTNGNAHQQMLDLRGVIYGNSDGSVTFTGKDDQTHAIQPIPLNTSTVGVYCDCEDYQMRFALYNLDNNCHVGPAPVRYVRKTTDRPPANPSHAPGMCKHLLRVVDHLKQEGIIQPSSEGNEELD